MAITSERNRYPGKCGCGKQVGASEGFLSQTVTGNSFRGSGVYFGVYCHPCGLKALEREDRKTELFPPLDFNGTRVRPQTFEFTGSLDSLDGLRPWVGCACGKFRPYHYEYSDHSHHYADRCLTAEQQEAEDMQDPAYRKRQAALARKQAARRRR